MTPLNLQHELDRRIGLARTTEERVQALEFILRLALKELEAKP